MAILVKPRKGFLGRFSAIGAILLTKKGGNDIFVRLKYRCMGLCDLT